MRGGGALQEVSLLSSEGILRAGLLGPPKSLGPLIVFHPHIANFFSCYKSI